MCLCFPRVLLAAFEVSLFLKLVSCVFGGSLACGHRDRGCEVRRQQEYSKRDAAAKVLFTAAKTSASSSCEGLFT